MKSCLKRILQIFMTLTLVFLMVIINNDKKIENQENYSIMQKANNITKEDGKTEEKDSFVPKKDENPKADEKQDNEKTKTSENKKEEKKVNNTKKVIKKTSVEKSVSTQAAPNNKTKDNNHKTVKYGTFGRLYISNYSAALYDYNVYTKSDTALQTIVDNKDSAAYYKNHGKLVIADHYNQGFKVLINLSEGNTLQIKFEDGNTIRYKLIKKSEGINAGYDLIDSEGNSFFEMESDLIMYTCYNDGIMATLWVKA